MVIYGYESELEQEKREMNSFREVWNSKKLEISRDIPINDAVALREIYRRTPHDRLEDSPFTFVEDIAWRIYTEWCLSPESQCKYHNDYHGQAFTKFVDDETFFAMNRVIEKGLVQGGTQTHKEIRYRVLEAIVKRAIELFSDWNSVKFPKMLDDKRNLRADLREYIGF